MSATQDDKRTAVGLSTNLSGQLVQAAVTMLTVEGAYVAYALVSRETHSLFGAVSFFAALAFVASVYLSGKAITKARNSGFTGNWDIHAGKQDYGLQAFALIVGLMLLAATLALSGKPKESDLQRRVDDISLAMENLRRESTAERERLSVRIQQLQSDIAELRSAAKAQPSSAPKGTARQPK